MVTLIIRSKQDVVLNDPKTITPLLINDHLCTCKGKQQQLLTFQVSSYCCLPLHGTCVLSDVAVVVLLRSRHVFSYKLRYIIGFGLVEMAISTNPKPMIYRNLYDNTSQAGLYASTKDNAKRYIIASSIYLHF